MRRRKKTENGTTVWYNYDAAGNVINVEHGTGPDLGFVGQNDNAKVLAVSSRLTTRNRTT